MAQRDSRYILEDPAVERWLRFKEPSYKNLCSKVIRYFLDFAGPELGVKDPSNFVAWAKSRPDILEVQDFVEKFGEAQTQTSQLYKMSIVRSLLKRNGLVMPSMSGKRLVLKDFHRGYTREELQSLLGFLDSPIQKLYVMFAKDTGLRAQDLLALKYRHVKKDLDGEEEFVHLYLEPAFYNRRKASGRTFIGPATLKLLRQLIAEGKIKKNPDEKLFPFMYATISESLRIAKKKANLDPLIQPNHGARKFFENALDKTGLDLDKKRQIEGHALGTRTAYTDRDVGQLRSLYRKAYKHLDLSEEAVIDKSVLDLKTTIENQAKTITEQKRKIEALEGLHDEVAELQEVATFARELMRNPDFKQFVKSLDKKPK